MKYLLLITLFLTIEYNLHYINGRNLPNKVYIDGQEVSSTVRVENGKIIWDAYLHGLKVNTLKLWTQ
jgi:hypothetical protein